MTHHGGIVSTPITVTITGTNDAPDIAADTDRHRRHRTSMTSPRADIALTTSGSLAVTDVDLTDTVAVAVHAVGVGGSGNAGLPARPDRRSAEGHAQRRSGNVIDNAGTGTARSTGTSTPATQAFDFLADRRDAAADLHRPRHRQRRQPCHRRPDRRSSPSPAPTTRRIIAADTTAAGTDDHDSEGNAAADHLGRRWRSSDADVTDTRDSRGPCGQRWRQRQRRPSRRPGRRSAAGDARASTGTVDNAGTGRRAINWNFNCRPQAFDFLGDGDDAELRPTRSTPPTAMASPSTTRPSSSPSPAPTTRRSSATQDADRRAVTDRGQPALATCPARCTVERRRRHQHRRRFGGIRGRVAAATPASGTALTGGAAAMLSVDPADVDRHADAAGAITLDLQFRLQALRLPGDGETLS